METQTTDGGLLLGSPYGTETGKSRKKVEVGNFIVFVLKIVVMGGYII